MKEIKVLPDMTVLVDDDDYIRLKKYEWHYRKDGYVGRSVKVNEKHRTLLIHRDVMKAKTGTKIDHINHDKLDNRKCNLRFCNQSQNMANCKIQYRSKSGYKGIRWHKKAKKWQAVIGYQGKRIYLGLYEDIELARIVYRSWARRLFGEFAD